MDVLSCSSSRVLSHQLRSPRACRVVGAWSLGACFLKNKVGVDRHRNVDSSGEFIWFQRRHQLGSPTVARHGHHISPNVCCILEEQMCSRTGELLTRKSVPWVSYMTARQRNLEQYSTGLQRKVNQCPPLLIPNDLFRVLNKQPECLSKPIFYGRIHQPQAGTPLDLYRCVPLSRG